MRLVCSSPVLFMLCVIPLLPGELQAQQASRSSSYGELSLSEESVQLRYVRPRAQPADNIEAGELGFGVFLNEQRDIVASSNYFVEANRLRINRMSILVGPVAYAALLSEENLDVFAIALGAEARYRLLNNPQVTIVGIATYAPDILTFGSADNVLDLIARAEIPITNRVTGFGGFRLFKVELLEGSRDLEESIHLGLRYRF